MEVEIIKADGKSYGNRKTTAKDRMRVAAYCRVSTDDEDQIKSYNSMVEYYTDLIKKNPKWQFVEVYADKAITGTKVDKRENFQRMINDCMQDKIDMIIAKSIPRFARNTLDTLKYVRLLREKKIAVFFEVEHINTLEDGEFLITILSSVAQQEVENTSAYVKKGLKMKMKRGELIGFHSCLGYDYDPETKSLSVNEAGAETVRYIFERYCDGAGSTIIARELNERGIPTFRGNKWTTSGVLGVLQNEKYKGDLLQGKTFTTDPISKRRLDNKGEEEQYLIRNHHDAIISEEIYDKAQEYLKIRTQGRDKAKPGLREKYSRQYTFSCMIKCGFCGSNLSRRAWHSGSKYSKVIWHCVASTKKGKSQCPDSKGITEDVIESAFLESYRLLVGENKSVADEFVKIMEDTLIGEQISDKIKSLTRKECNIEAKRKKLLHGYLNEVITEAVYKEEEAQFQKELDEIHKKLASLEEGRAEEEEFKKRIKDFRRITSETMVLEEFDREVFESIIDSIIVGGYNEDGSKDPYKITFVYKTGFKDSLNNTKDMFGKKKPEKDRKKKQSTEISRLQGEMAEDLCSDASVEVNKLCCKRILNTEGNSW